MDFKTRILPISIQALNIRHMFPGSAISTFRDQQLTWKHIITSSPLGDSYRIKIIYNTLIAPKIFILEPKVLRLADGKTKLPHCYDQKTQQLCLFYPDRIDWNQSMLLTKTIIPWTYEWLYFYEIWLSDGEWTGGGTLHG